MRRVRPRAYRRYDRVRNVHTGWTGIVSEDLGGYVYRVRWDVTGNTGLPISGTVLERLVQ